MRVRGTKIGGVAALGLVASGCGTLYKLDVTAFDSADEEPGRTYVLLPAAATLQHDATAFESYADQLQKALDSKGYQRISADNWQQASLGIYLSTDISEPSQVFKPITRPIFAETSAEPRELQGRNAAESARVAQGGRPQPPMQPIPKGNLEGIQKTGHTRTVHTKHLSIQAIDLQQYLADIEKNGQNLAVPQEIWSLDVKTTGSSADLSEVVPVMIVAGQKYIGENTGKTVQVSISETDRRIKTLLSD